MTYLNIKEAWNIPWCEPYRILRISDQNAIWRRGTGRVQDTRINPGQPWTSVSIVGEHRSPVLEHKRAQYKPRLCRTRHTSLNTLKRGRSHMVVLPVAEATRRGLSSVDIGPSNVHVLSKEYSPMINSTSPPYFGWTDAWLGGHRIKINGRGMSSR